MTQATLSNEQQYVLSAVQSNDVRFIHLWFSDITGNLKSFAITPAELETAFVEGMGFDGSAIVGRGRSAEQDMLAVPDAATFQLLPWRPEQNAVARMFCDIKTPQGKLSPYDSRAVLKQQIKQAQKLGYTLMVSPEIEYYYLQSNDPTNLIPVDRGSYFDLMPLDAAPDLRRDTVLYLEKMGISVEYSHHEAGHSQHEIDLRFDDALAMADSILTAKMVIRQVASEHGVYASFMPKPFTDQPGSGLHLHLSLFDQNGKNVFAPSAKQKTPLSAVGQHFLQGLLRHAPAYTLLTNANVNSYKRLNAGDESPSSIFWSRVDKDAFVRIPSAKPNKLAATRLELRSPDPSCNSYLAIAAVLRAGLQGIESKLKLQAEGQSDADEQFMPLNLSGALAEFVEAEQFNLSLLGQSLFAEVCTIAMADSFDFDQAVTDWELQHYLPNL